MRCLEVRLELVCGIAFRNMSVNQTDRVGGFPHDPESYRAPWLYLALSRRLEAEYLKDNLRLCYSDWANEAVANKPDDLSLRTLIVDGEKPSGNFSSDPHKLTVAHMCPYTNK